MKVEMDSTAAMVVSVGVLTMMLTVVICYEVTIVPGRLESFNSTMTLSSRCECHTHCLIYSTCAAVSVSSAAADGITCNFVHPTTEGEHLRLDEMEGALTILKEEWSHRVYGTPSKTDLPGLWGSFGSFKYCSIGSAISGMTVRYDPYTDSTTLIDDIGLSRVVFKCSDRSGKFIHEEEFGYDFDFEERGPWECPNGSKVVGMKYAIQKHKKHAADDVGVVGLELKCNDRHDTILTLLDASDMNANDVGWSNMMQCPKGFQACGIAHKADHPPSLNYDSSGICEIKMDCCIDDGTEGG